MDRFYKKALMSLVDEGKVEISEDIAAYVKLINHERDVLINELGKSDTIGSKMLLARLGFKVA